MRSALVIVSAPHIWPSRPVKSSFAMPPAAYACCSFPTCSFCAGSSTRVLIISDSVMGVTFSGAIARRAMWTGAAHETRWACTKGSGVCRSARLARSRRAQSTAGFGTFRPTGRGSAPAAIARSRSALSSHLALRDCGTAAEPRHALYLARMSSARRSTRRTRLHRRVRRRSARGVATSTPVRLQVQKVLMGPLYQPEGSGHWSRAPPAASGPPVCPSSDFRASSRVCRPRTLPLLPLERGLLLMMKPCAPPSRALPLLPPRPSPICSPCGLSAGLRKWLRRP